MIAFGIDLLLQEHAHLLRGARVGILAHAASLNLRGESTVARLRANPAWQVTALFGPEHGLATVAQDMEPVDNATDETTKLPVYSLYGDSFASLSPTADMLRNIDVLVVDLQDIGARYYTYIWTTVLAMRACAAAGKRVIVCDRPNPLNGIAREGAEISAGFESFVGLHSLPVRHGMTIGEISAWANAAFTIGCDVTVIPMRGWERRMSHPHYAQHWINPSPNMRSYEAALLYPGMCLLEATNVSEGRGTDYPFLIVGAPYIDERELMHAFDALHLPGIIAWPCRFTPTRHKWAGQLCHGIRWSVSDDKTFPSYLAGLHFVRLLHDLYRDRGFSWRNEPYEFVADIPAIDLLTGSDRFRSMLENGSDDMSLLAKVDETAMQMRKEYFLY